MRLPTLEPGLASSMTTLSLVLLPGVNIFYTAAVFFVLAMPHFNLEEISGGNLIAAGAFLLNAAVQMGGRKERLRTVERDIKNLTDLIESRTKSDDKRWSDFRDEEKERVLLLHSWQEGVLKSQQHQEDASRVLSTEIESLKSQLRNLQQSDSDDRPRRRG